MRASSGFRLPRLKTAVATILLAASSSLFASSYFVVVPVPARTSSAAENISVSLSGYALPSAIVGQPYAGFDFKRLLSVTGDSQYTGYGVHWSVVGGALPAGLVLNGDGTLSGTPTAAGTASFQVMASYKAKAGEQSYQVFVANVTVSLATGSPPQAIVGQAYRYDLKPLLSVTGDNAYSGSGVTWATVSSSLPAGLSLGSDGTISGTPTASGTGSITARASYRGVNGQQTYQVVTLAISVGLAAGAPPQAIVGQPYGYDLKQLLTVTGDSAYAGNGAGVTWNVVSNSLPAGLYLTSDGWIGGTPTAGGTGSITARASYRGVNGQQTYQVVTLAVTVGLAAGSPPQAIVGQAYSYDLKPLLSVTGDNAYNASGVTWSTVSSSLPAGLSLGTDGTISGTPAASGTGSITARATYRGVNGQQTYQVVTLAVTVSLAAGSPPQAIVGQTYSYDLKPLLTVTGDSTYAGNGAGVTWNVVSNTLPAGLYLTSDGWIGGTPTAAGTGSITARATYRGVNGQQIYQVATLAITVSLGSGTPPQGVVGTAYTYDLKPLLTVSGDPSYTGASQATWSVVSGGFPAGLSLAANGVISGTPTAASSGPVTIQAAYRGSNGQQTYQLFVVTPGIGTLSVTSLSFAGQARNTVSAPQSVSLTNTGGTALSITGVTGTSPFAVTNTCPASLAPNQSCSAKVTFNPTTIGTQSGTVVFGTSAGNKTVSLTGLGQGTVLSLNTTTVDMGTVGVTSAGTPQTTPTQTVTITNNGNIPTTSLSIGSSGAVTQTTTCGQALAVGASCSVTFSWAPTAATTLNVPVTIASQDTSAQLTVTGTATQLCTASPTVVLAQADTPVSVPRGCGHMQAELWGAGGGGSLGVSAPGGGGGYTNVYGVPVSTSTSLVAKVGAGGLYGNANYAGGGGGGGTYLWLNGNLQVAAGGGGGAGGFASQGTGLAGAPGGGTTGGTAANQTMNGTYTEYGGAGASQSAGGAARPGTANINCGGGAGSYNLGGSAVAGCSTAYGGTVYGGGGSDTLGGPGNGGAGGGGGGYYGGSAGAMGGYNLGGTGGGGGSGWFAAGLTGGTYPGSGSTPSNASNSYRTTYGAGQGNAGAAGYGGLIVFTWSQ
ncbi:putative Ig domain-containing protein [Paraburkholderia sp. A2RO-4L]|uniref:beta strand repeat-containing protein n=1 Tax=Paraburkholderia sp. A2RO-4L TaxID=3028374 RepID=UPI003DA8F9A5